MNPPTKREPVILTVGEVGRSRRSAEIQSVSSDFGVVRFALG